MIRLRVRKFGDSLGVVLPKEVIDRLQTGEGQPLLLLEEPSGGYRITANDPTFETKMTKAEDIIGRYPNTLGSLAK